MKKLIFSVGCLFSLLASIAMADTTLSRDGDGLKVQGAAYGSIRSASVGTKGFKCFSTLTKSAWEVKIVDSSGNSLPAKYFYNGNESVDYPFTTAFFQFQNSPVSQSPTISKACMRKYSTATEGTAKGIFQ